ncbi:hypothetical protein EDD15DRAFT_2196145 [Pisolithus albus]|nr:hypothetical protein EDD15DRAFT_2196145 [Pisolithus albus]
MTVGHEGHAQGGLVFCLPMNRGQTPNVNVRQQHMFVDPADLSTTVGNQTGASATSSPKLVHTANRPVRFEEVDHGLQIPTNILFGSKHNPRLEEDRTAGGKPWFNATMNQWRIMHHFKTIAAEHTEGT